jgi:DNA transposition AAA+ family ATPase
MNNPEAAPIDVKEQRDWLIEHKNVTGASWTQLAAQTGIASGTLSVFGTGKYAGDNDRLARDILRFRQHLSTQRELAMEAPEVPEFIETPTARQLQSLLAWAQRGRMVVAVTGPGCGKTKSLRNYREAMSNVWLATMRPSCSGVNSMAIEVLTALGERSQRGTTQALSSRIRERLRNTGGLLAFDEAQELSERSFNEIRSWHDDTGVGIAFFGNEDVISRIEGGGRRRASFAQLSSRIGMRLVRNLPLIDDAKAIAEAWDVHDEKQVAFIVKKSQQPGGLRTVTMMLELATMVATSEKRPRELSHFSEAWAQLVSRPLAA